jgi:hypothetical protein
MEADKTDGWFTVEPRGRVTYVRNTRDVILSAAKDLDTLLRDAGDPSSLRSSG